MRFAYHRVCDRMMNIIVRANKEKFEEAKKMCKALEELMKDELEAKKTDEIFL